MRKAFVVLGLCACGGSAPASTPGPEVEAAVAASVPSEAAHACPHEDHGACSHAASDPTSGPAGHFGAAFSGAEPVALASVLIEPPSPGPVTVRGTIDQVCQRRGCWLVLRDGDRTARVLPAAHAFTVPIDSKGKTAVVEGTVTVRTFSQAQARHLEEDRGGDPNAIDGERREYVLTATGVEIGT